MIKHDGPSTFTVAALLDHSMCTCTFKNASRLCLKWSWGLGSHVCKEAPLPLSASSQTFESHRGSSAHVGVPDSPGPRLPIMVTTQTATDLLLGG